MQTEEKWGALEGPVWMQCNIADGWPLQGLASVALSLEEAPLPLPAQGSQDLGRTGVTPSIGNFLRRPGRRVSLCLQAERGGSWDQRQGG